MPVEFLEERVLHWSRALGVDYLKLTVKDQRTLWGSCSTKGNLSFNWRLLVMPPAVLDYIVIHELAHRVELNHSRRFWSVVEGHCPEHRLHRRWLRAHGPALLRRRVPRQLSH